ncbi:MAG TPA: hypothetical protein VGG74_21335 [Kofleriaceae bacterium]
MKTLALVIVVGLLGCADMPRAVHYAAIATEVVAEGSLACDAASTHTALVEGEMAHDPTIHETNTALGAHPDVGAEVAYFGGIGVALAGVNETFEFGGEHMRGATERHRVAADLWRIATNLVVTGIEIDAAAYNAQNHAHDACGI